jgi:hypothetical protein
MNVSQILVTSISFWTPRLILALVSNVPNQTLLVLLLPSSCRFIVLHHIGHPSSITLLKSVAFHLLLLISYK